LRVICHVHESTSLRVGLGDGVRHHPDVRIVSGVIGYRPERIRCGAAALVERGHAERPLWLEVSVRTSQEAAAAPTGEAQLADVAQA
jgi:hypothetical protein